MRLLIFTLVICVTACALDTLPGSDTGPIGTDVSKSDSEVVDPQPDNGVDTAVPDTAVPDTGAQPVDVSDDSSSQSVEMTYSLFVGDWSMPSGAEITKCVVKRLTNTEEVWVQAIRTVLSQGSHHMVVYKSDDTEERLEPFSCTPFTETLTGGGYPLIITQIAEETLAFPEGVALRFEPEQMIRLEAHFLNYYPEEIVAHGDVFFDTINLADVEHELDMLFYGTPDFEVPAGGTFQTPWHFLDVKDGKKVFALTGHTHQYGTNVEVKFGNSIDDEDPISVYPPEGLVFDWAEAPVAQYEPALSFTEGQGFFYRCTWDNTSNKKLTFGESATDEMCFFWAYYYPSDGYRFCINPGSYADQASAFGLSNIPEQLCCPEHALCSLLPLLIGNL